MSQADVIERLYYLPNTTVRDLSVILNLSEASVKMNIARLKKVKYVMVSEKGGYRLTSKGKDFAERFYI